MSTPTQQFDYIIVGSGIAGLYAALKAREHGSVLVLTKGSIDECNTRYAQGGIAAPIGEGDSAQLHLEDTIRAGAGLVDSEAARILTEEAADRIADLVSFGVPFDTLDGEITLGREGAHSLPRILHAGGDATGAHIELTLSSVAKLSRITILEHCLAARLRVADGTVEGVEALDCRTNTRLDFSCRFLILATGGAGQLYKVSTNPTVATGGGIALAYRVGAEVMDLEFFQFHPTALRMPGVQPFLISEAVRGEGAFLRNDQGRAFMTEYDPAAELAPRDVVARAILTEMNKTGTDHVYLDVTHLPPSRVTSRFPQIYRFCLDHGLDITTDRIPVSPAAHYTMGGVRTNTWGETNIRGLYACGEAACTGVHGANRLASTSLLEGLVWGNRAARDIAAREWASVVSPDDVPPWEEAGLDEEADPALIWRDMRTIQHTMWHYVGLVRSGRRLARALRDLNHLKQDIEDFYRTTRLNDALIGLRHSVQAALVVAVAAQHNRVSRGCHYRDNSKGAALI